MKSSFYKSQQISKDKMKGLIERKNNPAVFQFLVTIFIFCLANYAILIFWNGPIIYQLLAIIIYGISCCSIFACEHETVHNTAFNSNKLNRAAAYIVGFAHLYPPGLFRELHFTHHRYTHIPGKDPEISLGPRVLPSVLSNYSLYLSWISGLPMLIFKILMLISGALGMPEVLRRNFFPFVNYRVKVKIAIECWIYLILYGGIIYVGITKELPLIGIFIGQIVGHCFLAVYLSMEHNGLPHNGTILEKTRSMNTSKVVKYIMWNMPYHAEHHAYPAVPYHALPNLHEILKPELKNWKEDHLTFHFYQIKKMAKND